MLPTSVYTLHSTSYFVLKLVRVVYIDIIQCDKAAFEDVQPMMAYYKNEASKSDAMFSKKWVIIDCSLHY